jgi:hypothetical protein
MRRGVLWRWLDDEQKQDAKDFHIGQPVSVQAAGVILASKIRHLGQHLKTIFRRKVRHLG